ncbi:MAG: endonuclease VII domain-containing protein [Reyranella sp.]|uniref:endonuclease VII domain-containing protein n=1 Tax=Reyranella sp. TaxID=1929291 RepID=UPI003D0B2483
MERAQEGRCKICRRPAEEGQWKVLRVDHDHATGKIRGLLCHHCNVALGHFGDSPELLERAAEYLRCS